MKNNLIYIKKNCNVNSKKDNNGITLVALVITIIVLLILAGVTLNMVIGNNGIFKKANAASNKTSEQTAYEELKLKVLEIQTLHEGKATLKNIVEALRDDKKYTYIVNLQETASLSEEGEISTESDIMNKITTTITKILVVYKGYEFEIKDNLEVSYIRNVEETPKKKYTISYDLQGGANEKIQSQTKIEGKTLILNSEKPKKSGYTFKGWALEAGTNTASYQPSSEFKVDENTTLYAVWEDLYLFKNGKFGAGLNGNNTVHGKWQDNGVPFVLKDGTIQRTPAVAGYTNSVTTFQDLIQTNFMYAKLRIKYSITWSVDTTYCFCSLRFSVGENTEIWNLPFTNGQIQTVESSYIPINGSKLTLQGCDGNVIIYEIDIIDEKDSID